MVKYVRGLYEILVTEGVASGLEELEDRLDAVRDGLRPAEAADRIALHLGRVVQRVISGLEDSERVAVSTGLARHIIEQIGQQVPDADMLGDRPFGPGEVLRAIRGRLPDGSIDEVPEPIIPLLDTTLLTNAPGEPRVGHQLLTEIYSADRIDVVMAFIRRTGILPLIDALQDHCQRGRRLRVLTTTYTGSTEAAALELLRSAGAEVRVSYETGATRLHAKAWLFNRESGFSTAYIGSSNLTHSAQVTGLEWNVRVSGARNGDVIDKVAAVFESYWSGSDFVEYDAAQFKDRVSFFSESALSVNLSPVEVRLEPFQDRLLELIALSRRNGHHRNLLVSATGTGKTVMAAVDYARLRENLPRSRLLFVAHREEILRQSLLTFRQCLREQDFGEYWVGGKRPKRFDHVFASIQSLSAADLADLDRDHFDVVIVDEFHHAAAPSYGAILEHLTPVELLGLTATPERSDGLPLIDWFGGRIAAELRLWDAIDQQRLCPFLYYGIHDGLDLREVPWRRGRGYDVEGLSKVYCASDAWARQVIRELTRFVDDIRHIRCLGFCVSVEHARFMARIFTESGISATAVWSDSSGAERHQALADLAARRVNVVFSVDLFNEGVDVPVVDTLLLLRPTDSPTLFLQQLGRGLRRSAGKSACVVLDFVGHHRREYRFDRRFLALLGGTRRELIEKVEQGFAFLPAGCHMQLDSVASGIVLKSLKEAVPTRWAEKVAELRRIAAGDHSVSLSKFLHESGLDLEDVYAGQRTWSDLLTDAGLPTLQAGAKEEILRRATSRLTHCDDRERIRAYSDLLSSDRAPEMSDLDTRTKRILRMLVAQMTDKAITKSTSLADACTLLWAHPQVRREAIELLSVLEMAESHMHHVLPDHPDVPLQVHARYTRLEILAAFGIGSGGKVSPWQTGVYWAEEARTDLLAVTLDKTSGQFSPTTRYKDYAISRDLIHWESQGATRADSPTGRRYQNHVAMKSSVILFARLRADDRSFWCLGPAVYVSHRSEQPISITWRLRYPLPGDIFASFAAAVA